MGGDPMLQIMNKPTEQVTIYGNWYNTATTARFSANPTHLRACDYAGQNPRLMACVLEKLASSCRDVCLCFRGCYLRSVRKEKD